MCDDKYALANNYYYLSLSRVSFANIIRIYVGLLNSFQRIYQKTRGAKLRIKYVRSLLQNVTFICRTAVRIVMRINYLRPGHKKTQW